MKILHRLLMLLLGLALLLPAGAGAAQSAPVGLSITVQAGFEGYYKEQTWIPVTVRLENTGVPVEGTLEITLDDYIQPDVTYRYPIELPTTSRKEIHLVVYPDVVAQAVQVKLVDRRTTRGKAEAKLNYLNRSDPLFGVLSASPSSFSLLAELDALGELSGSAAVAVLDRATFPSYPQALEALNVIVLSTLDRAGAAALSPAQVQALQAWTAAGGRLVITGGPGWQPTTAGLEASGLLPVIPTGEAVIQDLLPLLATLRQGEPGTPVLTVPSAGIVISEGSLQPGAVALASASLAKGEVPLVAQMDYGAGRVFYLAFDPTLEPFASWDGLVGFYRQLLEAPVSQPAWLDGFQDWYSAQTAAQALPGLRLPSLWLILGLLGLYVLLLGPANFLLLRKLKRRELGWITIPVTVILSALLVFGAGSYARSGGALVGRVSIMQVWPGVEHGRVSSLVSLYSPNMAAYQVALPAPALIHRLPLNPPEPNQALVASQDGKEMQISGLRLDSGSLAPFVVETIAPAPELEVVSRLEVKHDYVLLTAWVKNLSDRTLQTVVIHTPAGTEELGALEPEQEAEATLRLDYMTASLQAPYNFPPGFSMPLKFGGGGPDAVIAPILGTTDYYQQEEAYWRYQMLFAAFGGYNNPTPNLGGVFLTAWSESAPYALELPGKRFGTHDATLYVVHLAPELALASGTLTLPPGIFARRVIENSSYGGTPVYLYSGQILVFEDAPVEPIATTRLRSLSLHLPGDAASGAIQDFSVSLWDYDTGVWWSIPTLTWGANEIPEPWRYVSPLGAVRIRVEGKTSNGAYLESLEISMVVEN